MHIIFYEYNNFYKFSTDEVLYIIEQHCRLFEQVLEEVKPDFIILPYTNSGRMQLFYDICNAKGIKIMMLSPSRFSMHKCLISHSHDEIDYQNEQKEDYPQTVRTQNEIKNYHVESNAYTKTVEVLGRFLNSKSDALKAGIEYFLFSKNENLKTHYTYYGRNKLRVFFYTILMSLKKRYRFQFIEKNFSKEVNSNENFIFFPLSVEPERTLLIGSPFNTNQIEAITHIVKSLPVGYSLYVKEHPSMDTRDWRKTSYYKKIMNLPNVKLIHPNVKSDICLKNCSLVITLGGTMGLDVLFHEKPSITFTKTIYSTIESVFTLDNVSKLPSIIREALETKVNFSSLNKFINLIEHNCFEFRLSDFENDTHDQLFYGGFLSDVEISESNMISLLDNYREQFSILADAHMKKIKQHKQHSIQPRFCLFLRLYFPYNYMIFLGPPLAHLT